MSAPFARAHQMMALIAAAMASVNPQLALANVGTYRSRGRMRSASGECAILILRTKGAVMYSTPDANAGLNRYLDSEFGAEAELRAEVFEATKQADIHDLAEQLMADRSKASPLLDWFIQTVDPLALLNEANARPNSMLGMAYSLAALEMAKHQWETRFGK